MGAPWDSARPSNDFRDDKVTIIVLANRTDINPEELALKVADLYLAQKRP